MPHRRSPAVDAADARIAIPTTAAAIPTDTPAAMTPLIGCPVLDLDRRFHFGERSSLRRDGSHFKGTLVTRVTKRRLSERCISLSRTELALWASCEVWPHAVGLERCQPGQLSPSTVAIASVA